jgi:ABC-type amino acid transport substrate-binding protein
MNRLLATAVAVLTCVAMPGWAGTLERIRDSGTFKIGFRTDAPPYSYKNTIGEPAGYTVALCKAVASQVKDQLKLPQMSVTYVPVTAENRFKQVDDGAIDLLCGATTMTLGRRDLVDFSLPVFIDGAGVLLQQDGPKGFRDLAGKKVGVRAGTTTEEALRNTLKAMSVSAEAVAVTDHRDGVAKLINGEISAYFADRAILFFLMIDSAAASKLRLAEDMLTYETYALALKKGDHEFRLAVDRALSRLYRSGAIMEVFKSALGSQTDPTPELVTLYRINAMPE